MELTPTQPTIEKTEEERKSIAQEVYDTIVESLHRLQALPEIRDDHSSIVELEGELRIAERALAYFDENEYASQAA